MTKHNHLVEINGAKDITLAEKVNMTKYGENVGIDCRGKEACSGRPK
jgi:hypothetical protein